MDYMKFLSHITTVPGTSGYEEPVAQEFARAFAPYCDEAYVDAMSSVIAVQKSNTGKKGPRVMLCAHIDEVGLMTMDIEEDGSVRFISLGVAAQTLPAQEVTILAKDGPIYGVIGSVPPHVTGAAERSRVTPVDELYIDTGLSRQELVRRVPAGTPVQLTGKTTALLNERVTSKTLDDRACASILLDCAMQMKNRLHDAEIVYLLSAGEERGCLGAITGTERLRPDMAVILDVTHGTMEDCAKGETFPIEDSVLTIGPNAHRKLTDMLRGHAKRLGLPVNIDAAPGNTWTDAWDVQVACEGVPCAVLSLPLKYMHTTVELGSVKLMRQQAHWLCEAVADLDEGWEETLCY